jgi:saccharopine dehydrogenase-like NADP-dependent oxidoreductase
MQILLLGLGYQGKAALYDLVHSPDVKSVVVVDINEAGLKATVEGLATDKVTPVHLDVREEDRVSDLMKSAQAVIILLGPAFRLPLARLAISQGVHFIETSYTLPEYLELGVLAKENNLAILPECGLDPGIDLLMAASAVAEFDEVHEFHSYGGGIPIPEDAHNPLKYKISWTFAGVLAGYQQQGMLWVNGKPQPVSANEIFNPDNVHHVSVEGLGDLEAYPNGDVVKYLEILNLKDTVKNAGRYSMRWPGHTAFWKKMSDLGFLNIAPINVAGEQVSPRQFLNDLLEPQLQYSDGERDAAIVRVDVTGLKDGQTKRVIYEVVDYRDLETGFLAMQRTVGFTASIGAQMIVRGDIQKRGLLSPITDVPADLFFAELRQRGILVQRNEMDR